jgi:hypothetical protein
LRTVAVTAAKTTATSTDLTATFDTVVNDGGWEGGGYEEAAVLATATTASTAAAGYDSDILEVVSPTAVGSLKNNLPLGFVPLSEDIKIRMLSSLDTNSSSANINSFGKSTLKGIIDDIVVVKGDLLQHAAGVDKIYRDMLDDVIPDHVGMKMKKHCMCQHFIKMWDVFRFLLSKKSLSVTRGNQIYNYLRLMEKLEAQVKQKMERADEVDKNARSLKISETMMNRGHLESGNFKLDFRLYPVCAKCKHSLIDQPKENKNAIRENSKAMEEWKRQKKQLENFLHHGGSPLVKNGKTLSKVDNVKEKEVIIICHCWQNKHSFFAGGSVCALLCKDPATDKQYKMGQCPVCVCSCAFVCTTA